LNESSATHISENFPLDKLNSFAVSATAAWFVQIDNLQQLERLKQQISGFKNRLVLGGGSNILFVNDFSGLVIYPRLKGIKVVQETSTEVTLSVAASENWHEFVDYCIVNGYFGLENLALIPGTVGAAPVQNIGAYGVEIEKFISKVNCFDLDKGEYLEFSKQDCQFKYRDSFFKRVRQGRYLVTSVVLALSKIPDCVLDYKPLKAYFSQQSKQSSPNNSASQTPISSISPRQVFDRVCAIRQEKLPDPKQLPNAGSFFKNPIISKQQYDQLLEKFPNIVVYPLMQKDKQVYKVAAGWLIEQAGFKGKTYGKIGVYAKQALVLVNYSDKQGSNILELAQNIVLKIRELFQIELEAEVRIID